MSDDELLAAVMRRFLNFLGHEAYEPFVLLDVDLVIDGRVDLSPEEYAAVSRVRSERPAR